MQRLLNKEYRNQKQALKSLLPPTNYACPIGPIVEIINLYYDYYYVR